MTVRILRGDVRDRLKDLPDESVHCVVTSPPYFGLRDYGVEGQIGLEDSPQAFVATMVDVFREVRRVLRSDGTAWVNIGDSYAGSWGAPGRPQGASGEMATRSVISARQINAHPRFEGKTGTVGKEWGLKPKDMMLIPFRLALALQADGWWVRQDIIWHKKNPMPESIRDRATKAHEYLFLLAKSERYYFDFDAFSEPRVGTDDAGVAGWASGDAPHDAIAHNRQKGDAKTFRGGQYVNGNKFQNSHATERTSTGNRAAAKETRNRRSVWSIATEAFEEGHFATFPTELVKPCILAGCPVGGTVLDPFGGAGTTGLVASSLQRDAILIELNEEYAAMAERRIHGPLFAASGD